MSPLSPIVLGAGALVSSQAIWDAVVEQTLALDQALIRYLVAVAVCWALLSLLAEFAFKTPPVATSAAGDTDTAVLDPIDPATPAA